MAAKLMDATILFWCRIEWVTKRSGQITGAMTSSCLRNFLII